MQLRVKSLNIECVHMECLIYNVTKVYPVLFLLLNVECILFGEVMSIGYFGLTLLHTQQEL